MGMTRQERVALHSKQERTHIRNGTPVPSDLKEGVTELRSISGSGLVEFVKHNGVLHKKILDKTTSHSKSNVWYEPTMQNSWVAYNTTYNSAQYMIDGNGFVHIRGLLKNGSAADAVMFTLPDGYRPEKRELFISYSAAGATRLDVFSTGAVQAVTNGSTSWTSIDGLIFYGGY